ncbi:MAG: M20/M25/M40 family metallo-hydrolase [Oscillospiraceae bacterium]|nr:M20/M25/M40 family metallo-hydrolase [Oscillospiraceae bacterium]
MMKTFLENLEILSMARGTSGDESAVRKLIYDEVLAYPDCIAKTDNAGNLIVSKKGKTQPKNKLMFSAHMDEIGFIITHIEESGFLRFSCIGSVDSRVIVGKRLLVGRNAIPGLLGSKAIHLVKKEEFDNPTKTSDLYIDIGAENREEAEKLVSIGDRAVFDSDFEKFGDGCVMGRALDDRAGCAMLMELLKEDAEYDFTVCFTTREEIGGNGAPAAAFGVDPDIAVVVEATTAGDYPCVPGDKFICKQGLGPVVSFRDNGTLYDMEIYQYIMELCGKENIPVQTKHGICGGNDAEAIHKARGGIRPVAVSLPARYIHSPYATLKISDMENTLALIKILSKNLCEL